MFSNIGGKIKGLAKFVCWVGIIASVIAGILMCVQATEISVLLTGILTAIVGAVISWVASFVLYGFGQLVENSDILVQKAKK